MSRRKSLSEVLIELGYLSPQQLAEIRRNIQERPGSRLGERAVELGFLTETQLCEATARQFNLQMVPSDRVQRLRIAPEALSRLPPSLIRERLVVPTFLDTSQGMLSLLVADPTDLPALKAAQEFTGTTRLRLFLATRSALKELIAHILPEEEKPVASIPTPPPETSDLTTTRAPEEERSRPGPRQGRVLVLEPDPERLAALKALDVVEGARSAYVSDEAEVASALRGGGFDRLLHRPELAARVKAHLSSWRAIAPGLEVTEVSGYGSEAAPPAPSDGVSEFLLKLVEFTLLAGETKNMNARARARRAVQMSREVAKVVGLSPEQRDTLLIGALFLYLDQLSLVSGMVGDTTEDLTKSRRFELALAVMEPLEPPLPIAETYGALERRLLDPDAPRSHLVAELLYTLKAIIEKGPITVADAASLLGSEASQHDPEVLAAFSTVLRREQLLGRLAKEGGAAGGSTVVVAEREASLVTALERRLAQSGYEVVAVADGASALERIKTLKPVAVIANRRLPRRDGLSLLLEIKRDEELAHIPVIILTERSDGATVAKALDFGAEDVLDKPINLQVLMARLRKAAGRPKRTRSTGIVGRLADLGLLDLLQTLHLGSKSAEVIITAPAGRGTIHLMDGQLIAASYDRLTGEQAVFALSGLSDGLFEVRFGTTPPIPNIGTQAEQLLLEAARRLDEDRAEAPPKGALSAP